MHLASDLGQSRPPRIEDYCERSFTFDPLQPDEDSDIVIETTERRLIRLTMLACDVGARFARDQIAMDPAVWMLNPRRIFLGKRPLEACQSLEPFIQGIILHAASPNLDADPEDVIAMAQSELGSGRAASSKQAKEKRRRSPTLRLYSCCVEGSEGFGRYVQAFCAIIAPNESTVRDRLRRRFGLLLAREAIVRRGFDGNDAFANALLSQAARQLLMEMAAGSAGKSDKIADLYVEQRFTAKGITH